MAAATTQSLDLTAGAWADITPTGIVVMEGLSGECFWCLSSETYDVHSIGAAAHMLKQGEKIMLKAADLGGANVLIRAASSAFGSVAVVTK